MINWGQELNMEQGEVIKLIIADDDDFVRDGLTIILDMDESFEVVAASKNGKEAVEAARRSKADVILMDIQMPVMDGIEATDIIVKEELGKVLILTTFDDDELVEKAIKRGAKGYLIKNHKPEKLKHMIKAIYHDINILDKRVYEKIGNLGVKEGIKFDFSLFTQREIEIIEAASEGLANKEIAERLFISEGTVKNHISVILNKAGMSHRTQLIVYYLTGKK